MGNHLSTVVANFFMEKNQADGINNIGT